MEHVSTLGEDEKSIKKISVGETSCEKTTW